MRRAFSRFAVVLFLAATPAMAEDFPAWAYPVVPPSPAFDSVTPKSMPGSDRQYTEAQIEDDYNPPDWFPQDHPPMPKVVAHGTPPAVRACSKCHVPNGAGHPESSDLAGLSANYITAVMADYKGNNRKGIRNGTMIPISKQISDAEIAEAAAYFAALKPIEWTKVVETDRIAIVTAASALIVMHNHPSGESTDRMDEGRRDRHGRDIRRGPRRHAHGYG